MAPRLLPTVLYTLTCLSLFFSAAIFILSLMSFGLISLWIDAASAIFTIIYHILVLSISYRRRNKCPLTHPPITPASISLAFFIVTMWIIAFGITTEVTVNGPGSLMASEQHARWNQGVQVGMSILTAIEAASVGAIVIYCCMMKKSWDLENQACQDEKTYYVANAPSPSTSSPTATSEPSNAKLSISPPRSIRLQPPPAAKARSKASVTSASTPGPAF